MPFPQKLRKLSTDITTHSVDETREFGQKLGAAITHPLAIALIGDLGSGKTAFVQGLAKGLEVPADYYITSPTFTLINEYPGRLPLLHVDLYRLETIRELEDIGLDELYYGRAVLAIEWADKLAGEPFDESLSMSFKIMDDNCRKISILGHGQIGVNLIEAVTAQSNFDSTKPCNHH
jgi:tRNA threonylcarbamoyladenosine biosynthesis protein TsaE